MKQASPWLHYRAPEAPLDLNALLGVSPRQYSQMLEELCDSAVEVGRELAKLASSEKRWCSITKNMLHAWDRGIQDVRSPNSRVSLAPVIEKAGFSDYDKLTPAPRTGAFPLLASGERRRRGPCARRGSALQSARGAPPRK